MALSTYSELQASIATWLNRTDLTDAIKDFIALAEADFNRKLNVRDQETYVQLETLDGQTTLPDGFAGLRNIEVQGQTGPLQYVAPEFLDGIAEDSGTAIYYTIQGNYVLFYPAPADETIVEMRYRERVPALSDSATTNWLLTKHPDVYLYGALVHSAPFLVEDERLQTWATLFAAAVEKANDNDATEIEGAFMVLQDQNGNVY